MIKVEHIFIKYKQSLLEDAEIEIANGKLTSIVGQSGIGKTSLLYLLGLISSADYRVIYKFNNHQINLRNDKERADFRRHYIGYVFQENNLFSYMTIEENFKWLAQMSGGSICEEDMHNYLGLVRLDYLDLKSHPQKLSGGERQRLNVALVLSKKPKLLLLDEPTSALDNTNKHILIGILKDIIKQEKIAILVVTHDNYVRLESDCVYEIKDKKILISEGSNQEIEEPSITASETRKINKYLSHYSFTQVKRNLWFYIIGFLFSGIVLGGCLFFQSFNKDYQTMVNDKYGQTRLTEIRVASSDFNEADYNRLKNDDRVSSIYPYAQYQINSIVIDNKLIEKDITIEFYNERMLFKQGIYISENIMHVEQRGLPISITINDETYQYEAEANIVSNYTSLYSENENIVLIPIEELTDPHEMLVYVKDINSVDGVIELLKVLNPNIELQNQGGSVKLVQTAIANISHIGLIYTGIIFLVIVIMLFNMYNRILANRKTEFILLKTNGLTKQNIRFIMNIEIICHIAIMSLFCIIGNCMFTSLFYHYYELSLSLSLWFIVIKCSILSSISVILISGISLYRLNKYEASDLLRQEI